MPLTNAHADAVAGGSPLYQLSPEHVAGLVALAALAIFGIWFRHRRLPALAPIDWLLVALLASSAAIHAGLALGQSDHGAGLRILFLGDAFLLALVARRVLRGASAGRLGAIVLVGSIAAYWYAALTGELPDQLGVANKLGEILALAIVVRPAPIQRRRAVRSFARSTAIALLVLGTAASAWVGAFRGSGHTHDLAAQDTHEAGAVAPPGTVFGEIAHRDATPSERIAAEQLVITARTALAKYADPKVAAADGYHVEGMHGLDFHAENPAYQHDGRILDPAHPESLVYGVAPDGRPVLLGALFSMPDSHATGPAVGGPLTMWHAHQHICVSLTPPALTGVLSPLGDCPVGSFDLPLTSEMIHIWIVPGAPVTIGDLDETWRRAYLSSLTRP